MKVKYSCAHCGLDRVECNVRERTAGEDVVVWVRDILGHALKADHRRRSPLCQSNSAQDVMIPMTGTDYIGGPVKQ